MRYRVGGTPFNCHLEKEKSIKVAFKVVKVSEMWRHQDFPICNGQDTFVSPFGKKLELSKQASHKDGYVLCHNTYCNSLKTWIMLRYSTQNISQAIFWKFQGNSNSWQ